MTIRTIHRFITASVAAAGIALVATGAQADVPTTITHQGRLYDAANNPVKETTTIVFRIYDGLDAGALAIWSETHDIAFDDGYFSVELGKTTPLDGKVFDGSVRYLGIQVGNDSEMTPRAAVRSVPYAILANDVNGDINPHSVSIQGFGIVIDESGQWVGDTSGLIGPAGPQGPTGPQGTQGSQGIQGA
ncbi:MAG TPA: collagen-like protein, partial [Polyangiaceae bacterium]|nr:collagen-like protein [Polyangiaceae bacterium]